MSILDAGPHTVLVYPEITTTDSRGNVVKKPGEVGVLTHGCTLTPVASNRTRDRDERVRADYRLITRSAPLGRWSRVEWCGRTFAVLDGPHEYNASPETKHIAATIREER